MKLFNRSEWVLTYWIMVLPLSLLFAGCSPDRHDAAQNQLIVYDWSMADRPEFHAKFMEKHPELKPQLTFFATDEEGYGKAKGGFAFDVVHPCSQFFRLYAKSGLLQPIDTAKIKHWNELIPAFAEAGKVDGVQYFMPYDWGYESILVRTDKVQKIPESWADLWDPQYAGHMVLYDAADSNHIVTSLALGLDPWNTTPAQDEQIRRKQMELRPNLLGYWMDFNEINQLVAKGDAWIAASVWNDAYATLKADGLPVEYITPKEGRIGWMCGYAISSRTKDLDLVYDYLNALLDPKSHAAFGDTYAYGVSSVSALALMDPKRVKMMQLDDADVQSRTVFYKDWTEAQRKEITERWSQVRSVH